MSAPFNPPTRRIIPSRTPFPVGPDGLPDLYEDEHRPTWVVGPDGLPDLYEDEGEGDMGETSQHSTSTDILFYAVKAHLAAQPEFDVRVNINVYYRPVPDWTYFSPDVMVTRPPLQLPRDLRWYRLGEHGPAPVFVAEVLSRRSFQQRDLDAKPELYHRLGIAEYLLADTTGEFLPVRLLLKRRTADGWEDTQDTDGGITSDLGFRVVVDADRELRVVNAATGHRYPRPEEADSRICQLEAENARLRGERPQ